MSIKEVLEFTLPSLDCRSCIIDDCNCYDLYKMAQEVESILLAVQRKAWSEGFNASDQSPNPYLARKGKAE